MVKGTLARAGILVVCALAFGLALASVASASDHRRVRIQDDCEPVTFNAFGNANGLGDLCVGDGDTVWDDFFAQVVARRPSDKWRFDRDEFGLDAGGTIDVVNQGGEFHTFSQVRKFGGGCVELLNAPLGLTPVDECADPATIPATGLAPAGGTLKVTRLAPGVHRFMCLIHPWMRSVVEVRKD